MTGGVPYGRPMAERADDRDGLSLDQLPVRIGPLLPWLPPGLAFDVKLQGDLVQEAVIEGGLLDGSDPTPVPASMLPFLRALRERVPVAELEVARARSLLRTLADGLLLHGLSALSARTLRLVSELGPSDADAVRRLARSVRRTRLLGWATAGVGMISAQDVEGLGLGPVARAAGLPQDERVDDPAYRALGFEPVVGEGGDASARWRQRLDEAAQSLELAARAGDRLREPTGSVEGPRGRLDAGSAPSARLLPFLPGLIEGLDFGDAAAAVASLGLDLEEDAAARAVGAEAAA